MTEEEIEKIIDEELEKFEKDTFTDEIKNIFNTSIENEQFKECINDYYKFFENKENDLKELSEKERVLYDKMVNFSNDIDLFTKEDFNNVTRHILVNDIKNVTLFAITSFIYGLKYKINI